MKNNRQATESDSSPQFSDDKFYRALASTRRRRLLYYLLDAEESTVEELATVLTGWEATETGRIGTPDDREDARVTLIHVDLPRLADAGLISYEPGDGAVRIASLGPGVSDVVRRSVEFGPSERP